MKSIEERAELNLMYEKDFCGHSLSDDMVCRAYVRGAKEQKAIDDAKWLKIKSSWEKEAQINHDDEANRKQGYHDAIEKACEWLGPHLAEVADLYDSRADLLLRLVKENFRIAMEKEL